MTRVDLRAAIDMLPAYHRVNANWSPNGRMVQTNNWRCPDTIDRAMKKLMREAFRLKYEAPIRRVDVSKEWVTVLHRCLKRDSLDWLMKRDFRWQDWPEKKLPVLVRYKGRYIVWNGTHRMTLCKLTKRKLRAFVFDLEDFVAWRKKNHPHLYKKKAKRRGHK